MIRLGLAGSHRTGKTSLAQALSQQLQLPLIKTNTSAIFKQYGLNPATSMNITTRLWIQNKIIQAAIENWQTNSPGFVTDRTPLDFMAYTLAEIQGSTDVEFQELEAYLQYCFEVTQQFFTQLVIIPPAIPLVYEEGKAALNRAYMEHLNIIIQGLCYDERLTCPFVILPRKITNLPERVQEILKAFGN